jgi:protein TonB
MKALRATLRSLMIATFGLSVSGLLFTGLLGLIRHGGSLPIGPAPSRIDFTPLRADTKAEPKPRGPRPRPPKGPSPVEGIDTLPCPICTGAPAPVPVLGWVGPVDRGVSQRPTLSTSGFDGPPVPTVRVLPEYPPGGRGDGWVLVEFDISARGSVVNARVIDASPRGVFEKNALRAIERWRYHPAVFEGRAVESRGVRVRLSFVLERA